MNAWGEGALEDIPDSRLEAELRTYVDAGRRPGPFLTALLSNDLRGAVLGADDRNRGLLAAWMAFCDDHLPIACWGSEAMVRRWTQELSRALNEGAM